MFGLKKDEYMDRKKQILEWVNELVDFFKQHGSGIVAIKDNSGNHLVSIQIKNLSFRNEDRQKFLEIEYDTEKKGFPSAVILRMEKVIVGWDDSAWRWDMTGAKINVPDSVNSASDFRTQFKQEMTTFLLQDLKNINKDLYDLNKLNEIPTASERDIDLHLNHMEYIVRVYKSLEGTYDVDFDDFKKEAVKKLRDVFTNGFSYTKDHNEIPPHLVEFLVSLNQLFPCLETLDNRLYVLDDKKLSRPFIIKNVDGTYIRTTMMDDDYQRYALANKLME